MTSHNLLSTCPPSLGSGQVDTSSILVDAVADKYPSSYLKRLATKVLRVDSQVDTGRTVGKLLNNQVDTRLHDLFEERAAIYRYEVGHTKIEAERLAYQETLACFMQKYYPDILNLYNQEIQHEK